MFLRLRRIGKGEIKGREGGLGRGKVRQGKIKQGKVS